MILKGFLKSQNNFCPLKRKFEPIIAFLLKSCQFVFQKLFLIDEFVLQGAHFLSKRKVLRLMRIYKNLFRTEYPIKVFKVLGCEGLARVDFFLEKSGKLIVNEINTMPGFTKISMYPKLFETSGISYQELIDRLIMLAIDRFDKEKKLKTSK